MADTKQKSFLDVLLNGLLYENPTFVLMLGMCPTLGVTTAAINGVSMGLATTFVLVCSNLFISLLRKVIPDKVRLPAYIVIIASFVTVIDLLMQAFLPDLRAVLGTYIQLIVVNCIIFARAESFAAKNPPLLSIADGIGMGIGFTCAITILASIREIFGAGTLFGVQIMPESYQPMGIMSKCTGGFVTLGLLLILVGAIRGALAKRSAKKEAAA